MLGLAGAAQPARHDGASSIRTGAAACPHLRTNCSKQPHVARPARRDLRRKDTNETRHGHRPAAVPQGLHPRRRAPPGSLFRQARHQPSLRLAAADRARRVDARLRHRQPQRDQPGAGRRGGAAAAGRRAARARDGADPRHRARTTWASAATTTPGGSTCSNGAAPAPMPSISTSIGTRRTRRCAAACWRRSSAAPMASACRRASSQLKFDESDGRLFVAYYTHRFPITPRDYAAVLLTVGGPLEAPARAFAELGPGGRAAVREAAQRRARGAAAARLRRPRSRRRCAPTTPRPRTGQDRLHRLLERQHYRLAWWRAAADEINWRRFFDVNGLAGVRQEVPEVFEATHRTDLPPLHGGPDRRRAHRPCRRPRLPARILPQAPPPPGHAAEGAPAGAARRTRDHLDREDPRAARAPRPRLADRRHHRLRLHERRRRRPARPGRRGAAHRALDRRAPAAPAISRSRPRPPAARSCAKASAASCSSPPPRCTASPAATCAPATTR